MLKVTRSRRASKRSQPVLEDIPCRCELYRTNPEFHDVLLDFDRYSLAGVAEVMDRLDAQRDLLGVDEGMTWADFPDWVHDHLWQDPKSVGALARRLSRAELVRRDLRLAEEAVATAQAALRAYDAGKVAGR
ncbi:MAG TPA: hypothetical protein VK988_02630 [Acidimicrobiales bacterium]|nr:hypothetical protein [Acidimicrobiales bacterium]